MLLGKFLLGWSQDELSGCGLHKDAETNVFLYTQVCFQYIQASRIDNFNINCIAISEFWTLNLNSRLWVLETWFLSLKSSKFVILLGSTMYKGSVKCNKLCKAQNSISWISFIRKGAADGPWILEMYEICIIPGRSLGSSGFQDE